MSYWTKRRKIQSKFEEHLQNIAADNENYEMTGIPGGQVEGEQSQVEVEILHDSDVEDRPSVDPNFGSDGSSSDFHAQNSESLSSSSNDSESDDSEETESEYRLPSRLAGWAVENQITHTALGKLLVVLRRFHPALPKDPRTLLSTTKADGIRMVAGGLYYHFGITENILAAFSSDPELQKCDTIEIQVNVDGLPLFKSSNEQFWPILGRLTQSDKLKPFIIGLFSGKSKPSEVEEFLHDFVEEMLHLQASGLEHSSHTYNISIANFVCDTPARAYVKSVKSHTGYSGCDKCTQAGEHRSGRMTFPETEAPLRTDVAFHEMADEDHHLKPCALRRLSPQLGLVSQFPLDYMHLVCLGVMRRLLSLWLKGPLQCRIGGLMKTLISECLVAMRSHIPRDFARKPRPLTEIDRWKATEFRLFLLYTGPVALKDKIAKPLYDNFLLLSVAIHFLANPALYADFCDYAHSLLLLFVEHFSELYGADRVSYNVHGLVHLAEDVKQHGYLDLFSGFPFESFLGQLKKLVRKPNFMLQQVIMRLAERTRFGLKTPAENDTSPEAFVQSLKKQHTGGPLPRESMYFPCTEYKEAQLKGYAIAIAGADKCVRVGSDIVVVNNIISCDSGVYIVYKRFLAPRSFFSYPLDSTKLDIYTVANLSDTYHVTNISSIIGKYVLLPYGKVHVVMPVIHTV